MVLSDLLRSTQLNLGCITLHHFAHFIDHTVMLLILAKSCRLRLSRLLFYVLLKVGFDHLWLWWNNEWLLVPTTTIFMRRLLRLQVLRQQGGGWTIIDLTAGKCQVNLTHLARLLLLEILAVDSRRLELLAT